MSMLNLELIPGKATESRFKVALNNSRWELIDRISGQMVAWSASYEGLMKAEKEITQPFDDPINKMREGFRLDHLGKVLAARYGEVWK